MRNHRASAINKLSEMIPQAVLTECFNAVFMKALPHDKHSLKKTQNNSVLWVVATSVKSVELKH